MIFVTSPAIFTTITVVVSPRPEKKPDKAQIVLKAATTAFARKGFNKSTMVEVGNEADVAEGTIYEYYINKQDLLLSISKEQFKTYKVDLDQAFDVADPRIKLKRLIWHHFLILTRMATLICIYLPAYGLKASPRVKNLKK